MFGSGTVLDTARLKYLLGQELGVDSLMVDEAHYFKNAMVTTKMTRVAGISQTESQKPTLQYQHSQMMNQEQ